MAYGFCPICGAPGRSRERRPNGNDGCLKGHSYPSKSALSESYAMSKEINNDAGAILQRQAEEEEMQVQVYRAATLFQLHQKIELLQSELATVKYFFANVLNAFGTVSIEQMRLEPLGYEMHIDHKRLAYIFTTRRI